MKQMVILCDMCSGADAEALQIALNGRETEVDLCTKCSDKFDTAVSPYLAAGRQARGRARTVRRGARKDLDAVRTWARANGYEVSNRGRVPVAIMEAYESANAA